MIFSDTKGVSKITDGIPSTREDENTFFELSEADQKTTLEWIKENIIPRKTPLYGKSSYGIKHLLEDETKIYMTNNQFKHAMLIAGFHPVDETILNWNYCISKKSPCFKKE